MSQRDYYEVLEVFRNLEFLCFPEISGNSAFLQISRNSACTFSASLLSLSTECFFLLLFSFSVLSILLCNKPTLLGNNLFKDLNFEVVIVNDDSPDDSHSKLIDLQKQNSKIIT